MKTIRAVVIDDEFYNRDLITKLVIKTNQDFEIVGDAENIDDGFELINLVKPDLIFLDIKMTGGSGFDLLRKFDNPNFEVVFVTGFDEYAMRAFEFNALDYVLKPIDSSKLKNTLTKVQNRIYSKQALSSNLQHALQAYNNHNAISKIPVHTNDKVFLLEVNDILSIQSTDGYTLITTFTQQNKFISSKKLVDYEFIMDENKNFIRLNKSIYININTIKSYTKGQVCVVTLINGDVFEASRRKKTEILERLERK